MKSYNSVANEIYPNKMQKTKVNWDEIKSRINSQPELFDKKNILPEEKRSILKARAQTLAIEKKDETAQKECIEIVVFRLATETYGIESTFIREVYPLKDFTILPGTPSFVLGIVNVRGQIISIIDLKKFFNLPQKGLGELNKVIIIRNHKMEFGILVDNINDSCTIKIEDIQTSPISTNGIGAGYLRGVTSNQIIILDADRILGDKGIIVYQKPE